VGEERDCSNYTSLVIDRWNLTGKEFLSTG
jgi:hypothetical protein